MGISYQQSYAQPHLPTEFQAPFCRERIFAPQVPCLTKLCTIGMTWYDCIINGITKGMVTSIWLDRC